MRPRSTSVFSKKLILSDFLKYSAKLTQEIWNLIVKFLSSFSYNQIQRVYSNSSSFSFKFSQHRNFMMKELAQSRFFRSFSHLCYIWNWQLQRSFTPNKITSGQAKMWVDLQPNFNWKSSRHPFGRKSNISDRTLHILPWCFFVRNFHLLSRAKNWSLKQNR